jgi:glycosyltransferase involved in cell wall biosynthesis
MKISVLICAYNPKSDYLERTLAALKAQDIDLSVWELIVIDNNSSPSLEGRFNVSWHPAARIVVEEKQGLTPARLRAIEECRGELLVFVDDDNVLANDYLSEVERLFASNALLGCAGGSILPEFEIDPPEGSDKYLRYLGLPRVTRVEVSNALGLNAKPIGAGLTVRKEIANSYRMSVIGDQNRLNLGRTGKLLGGSEDFDLGMTACDVGYYCGVFPALELTHLISKERLTWPYLRKISEGTLASVSVLYRMHGLPVMSKLGFCKGVTLAVMQLVRGRICWNAFRVEFAALVGSMKGACAPLA